MKIQKIEVFPVTVEVRPEFIIVSSLGRHRISRYVIVRITTENGASGCGEATVMPIWSGETPESAAAHITGVLAPALIGRDPLELTALTAAMDRALWGNAFTKAAVEMALVDLAGRVRGAPACELLGGRQREPRIPLKFSIGAYPPAEAAGIAERVASELGLRAVKVKVGIELRSDIARVEAIRSAMGPDFPIGVDANGGWNEADARAAIPHLERLRVNALEQPLARRDFRGTARLRQRTSIPVMLDESIFTREDALEAIRTDACDLISIYPGKNGGMWRSLEIAQMGAAAGLDCIIGSNLEWDLGSAAMLHVAAAIPNLSRTVNHDIIGPLYHTRPVGEPPIRFEQGCAVVPEGAGLGVEVKRADLESV